MRMHGDSARRQPGFMAAAQHLLRTQDRRCGRYAPITSCTGNSLMSGGPCDSIPAAAGQHYGTLIDTAHEAILRRLDQQMLNGYREGIRTLEP